ncbi:DUF6065 family protein [Phyllobacterium lublinensis]|uniref:DUF6065 family protein n=1 Tax=Phyllobacterium lublinensis TaxID=2875708 RepID=UPI001CCB0A7A|nr:DUF6065 family protein [Phyllobacterium sp. 2063]MBZ9653789.1 DUF6065 family protein [Phyllobacterium sp. 2063]
MWDGHPTTEAIHCRSTGGAPLPAVSHFGHGIPTFHIPCLFETDPGVDLLTADEPFCHIFPVARGALEEISPTIEPLSSRPDLEREYKLWTKSRDHFNAALTDPALRRLGKNGRNPISGEFAPQEVQVPMDIPASCGLTPSNGEPDFIIMLLGLSPPGTGR